MVNVAELRKKAVPVLAPICIQMRTHLTHSLYGTTFCKNLNQFTKTQNTHKTLRTLTGTVYCKKFNIVNVICYYLPLVTFRIDPSIHFLPLIRGWVTVAAG